MQFKKGHKINKGREPWNKGKKGLQVAWNKGMKGVSTSVFKKGHTVNLGKPGTRHTPETKKKISDSLKGRAQPWNRGEKSNFWKGGISTAWAVLKSSIFYREWRESVFSRDDWTCCGCGQRGGKLEAHHIKPKSIYPMLVFTVSNGQTLCKNCHRKTDTFGNRVIKIKKQNAEN